MLKRLTALFAILILLLPSSLAAVVMQNNQRCLDQNVAPGCCCAHVEISEDQRGPVLARTCCCEFEAPRSMPVDPAPERLSVDIQIDTQFIAGFFEPLTVFTAQPSRVLNALCKGPPRAPLRPLFLRFQSFLI